MAQGLNKNDELVMFVLQGKGYEVVKEESGIAKCPYDLSDNATSIVVGKSTVQT